MEDDAWRITIDKAQYASSYKYFEYLKTSGGYAFTHVGRIERVDGSNFSSLEIGDLMEGLFRFLSFVRGLWVAPSLCVGFDSHQNRTWELWQSLNIERWVGVSSWVDQTIPEGLNLLFPSFMKRWNKEVWRGPIEQAVHWYVECNMCSGGIQGSIILGQAAFELLAWTILVDDKRTINSETMSRSLPANDKLRLLLTFCEIPLEVPKSLTALVKYADSIKSKQFFADGPQILTQIRNALVHSDPEKRKLLLAKDSGTIYEAWRLTVWYLELILLRFFDYHGPYSCRIPDDGPRNLGRRLVPWAKTSS